MHRQCETDFIQSLFSIDYMSKRVEEEIGDEYIGSPILRSDRRMRDFMMGIFYNKILLTKQPMRRRLCAFMTNDI